MINEDYVIDDNLMAQVISYNQARFKAFKEGEVFNEIKDFQRIINARYCKVSRIKKRLVFLISHFDYVYFCTFTFDDETIKRCDRTKRDLIKSTLNSFSSDIHYILNVDYGNKTDREHYHCLVGTNNNSNFRKYINKNYPCRSGVDRVCTTPQDIKKLSKYLNKLTNHCIKKSTKNKRIVYNFNGYDNYKELGRIKYILDSYNLGL